MSTEVKNCFDLSKFKNKVHYFGYSSFKYSNNYRFLIEACFTFFMTIIFQINIQVFTQSLNLCI